MALERVWYTDMNVALADTSTTQRVSQSIIWGLKALLVGNITGTNGAAGAHPSSARWTVLGSSDGTTAGLDGTDRWGASFDATKLVRASSGAHSWIVLRSPTAMGTYYYLTLDYLTSADANVIVVVSKTAPTGGTTSARPTSVDEWVHVSTALNENVALAHNLNITRDASGNFWFIVSRTGAGRFVAGVAFQTLTDQRLVSDAYPVLSIVDYNGNTTAGTTGPFHTVSSALLGAASKGRSPTGAGVGQVGPLGYKYATAGNDFLNAYGANADGAYDGAEVLVGSSIASYFGIRGRLPDVYMSGGLTPQGCVQPLTGDVERVFCGSLWLPFTVAPTL